MTVYAPIGMQYQPFTFWLLDRGWLDGALIRRVYLTSAVYRWEAEVMLDPSL